MKPFSFIHIFFYNNMFLMNLIARYIHPGR